MQFNVRLTSGYLSQQPQQQKLTTDLKYTNKCYNKSHNQERETQSKWMNKNREKDRDREKVRQSFEAKRMKSRPNIWLVKQWFFSSHSSGCSRWYGCLHIYFFLPRSLSLNHLFVHSLYNSCCCCVISPFCLSDENHIVLRCDTHFLLYIINIKHTTKWTA